MTLEHAYFHLKGFVHDLDKAQSNVNRLRRELADAQRTLNDAVGRVVRMHKEVEFIRKKQDEEGYP